jgi:perosamine synthetase
VLTSGEGGMVVTDDSELYENCRYIKFDGNQKKGKYTHERMGWNLRMSDINAAVGLVQLNKIDEIIKRKRENEKLYRSLLSDIEDIYFIDIDEDCFNVPFRTVIFTKYAPQLRAFLKSCEIDARPTFFPLHLQPYFTNYRNLRFENSVRASNDGVMLPSGANLTYPEIEYVCDKIKLSFKNSGLIKVAVHG